MPAKKKEARYLVDACSGSFYYTNLKTAVKNLYKKSPATLYENVSGEWKEIDKAHYLKQYYKPQKMF